MMAIIIYIINIVMYVVLQFQVARKGVQTVLRRVRAGVRVLGRGGHHHVRDKRWNGTEHATVGVGAGRAWALQQIEKALHGLQFGHVTVIVQDGVVVQVERMEKQRLQRAAP